ncbi:hypothetical protein QCA50_007304 [Cerrena zonata]|uniref:Uncharacterized protein n=1 Tax=Cerrena zonata TaxID=2478898 RepID=A0AAW0GAR2_9APHY
MTPGKLPSTLLKLRTKAKKKSNVDKPHSRPRHSKEPTQSPVTTQRQAPQQADRGTRWPSTPATATITNAGPNTPYAYGAPAPAHGAPQLTQNMYGAATSGPEIQNQSQGIERQRLGSPSPTGGSTAQDIFNMQGGESPRRETSFSEDVPSQRVGNLGEEQEEDEHEDEEQEEGEGEESEDQVTIDMGNYGRKFARMGGIFTAIGVIVEKGASWESECSHWINRNGAGSEEADPVNNPDPRKLTKYSERDRRTIGAWKILCDIIPGFREGVMELLDHGQPVKELEICQKLQSIATTCRGNDSTGLKSKSLYYIDPNLDAIQPEIHWTNLGKKAVRGWNHPKTAAMLLPLKHELTDENIDAAGAKQLPTHHHLFPRYLYPVGQPYVVNNEDIGLMQGHYIIYVCRHIFTGPKSVLHGLKSPKRSRKGTIAQRMGITALTPRAVAYACVQTHFAISNQESWDEMYWDFDLEQYYWNMVDILSHGPEGEAAMNHINMEVFGEITKEHESEHVEITAAQRIIAQRNGCSA